MFLENITEEQIEQFRQAFALFDKDGDGCINNKELKTVLRSLGHNPTKQELEIFVSIIDQDRNGTIDFRQFLILISQRLNDKTLFDEVVQSFSVMDKDSDGFLTKIQLKQIFWQGKRFFIQTIKDGEKKLSNQQIQDKLDDILDELDKEGEGKISIIDYVAFVLRNELKSHQKL